jgi:hypothetical protein
MSDQEEPLRITPTEARQGAPGQNVRIVMFTALAMLVVAGVILFFTVGTSWH